ncbi:hypothetical protein MTO96_048420 [Rhipicephalus appendiculatus]
MGRDASGVSVADFSAEARAGSCFCLVGVRFAAPVFAKIALWAHMSVPGPSTSGPSPSDFDSGSSRDDRVVSPDFASDDTCDTFVAALDDAAGSVSRVAGRLRVRCRREVPLTRVWPRSGRR